MNMQPEGASETGTCHALLILADISGFTQFMKTSAKSILKFALDIQRALFIFMNKSNCRLFCGFSFAGLRETLS
jgi:hypothetical protein